MLKAYRETFNDGFMRYGLKEDVKSSTGKKVGDTFNEQGRLAFRELSQREQDYQLANSVNSSLDLKVKTLFHPAFVRKSKTKFSFIIDGDEFETFKVESDSSKLYLYFYLQRVGAWNE